MREGVKMTAGFQRIFGKPSNGISIPCTGESLIMQTLTHICNYVSHIFWPLTKWTDQNTVWWMHGQVFGICHKSTVNLYMTKISKHNLSRESLISYLNLLMTDFPLPLPFAFLSIVICTNSLTALNNLTEWLHCGEEHAPWIDIRKLSFLDCWLLP